MTLDNLVLVGPAEEITLPELRVGSVPARIDTGAKTSAIWATSAKEINGVLEYTLFGKGSDLYTGKKIKTASYDIKKVTNSTGQVDKRYAIKLLVSLRGRRVKATFTLANRSRQSYPVLIGRNILRGKFIVNVKLDAIQKTNAKLHTAPTKTSGDSRVKREESK